MLRDVMPPIYVNAPWGGRKIIAEKILQHLRANSKVGEGKKKKKLGAGRSNTKLRISGGFFFRRAGVILR